VYRMTPHNRVNFLRCHEQISHDATLSIPGCIDSAKARSGLTPQVEFRLARRRHQASGRTGPTLKSHEVRRPWVLVLEESACASAAWTWQRPALPLVACAVALNLSERLRPTELSIAAAEGWIHRLRPGSVLR
jgi:hypothetical protein